MTEAQLEKKACRYAVKRGWLTFKFVSTSQRGVPDRLFFRDEKLIIIEFKAPGKKATKLQCAIHDKFAKHGFHVFIVDNYEQAKRILE
mgnify:CR=1 FL=1